MVNLYIILSLIVTVLTVLGYKQNYQLSLNTKSLGNIAIVAAVGPFLIPFFIMRIFHELKLKRKISYTNLMFQNTQFIKLNRPVVKAVVSNKKTYNLKPKNTYDFKPKE